MTLEAPMATDPREVERLADCLTAIGIPREQQRHAAAAKLRALAGENAALREKLEAAEAERDKMERSALHIADLYNARGDRLAATEAALTEARAAQAAAWEAGLSQPMPHDFIGVWHKVTEWCAENEETVEAQTAWGEVVRFLRSTPPADLSAALQRVRDEAWNEAIEAAADYAFETCGAPASKGILALRRAPTEDR